MRPRQRSIPNHRRAEPYLAIRRATATGSCVESGKASGSRSCMTISGIVVVVVAGIVGGKPVGDAMGISTVVRDYELSLGTSTA
jgi:hypothetical protein